MQRELVRMLATSSSMKHFHPVPHCRTAAQQARRSACLNAGGVADVRRLVGARNAALRSRQAQHPCVLPNVQLFHMGRKHAPAACEDGHAALARCNPNGPCSDGRSWLLNRRSPAEAMQPIEQPGSNTCSVTRTLNRACLTRSTGQSG